MGATHLGPPVNALLEWTGPPAPKMAAPGGGGGGGRGCSGGDGVEVRVAPCLLAWGRALPTRTLWRSFRCGLAWRLPRLGLRFASGLATFVATARPGCRRGCQPAHTLGLCAGRTLALSGLLGFRFV